jgi:fucose permease
MFLMHAIYGFGATVSPLVSTEFVKSLNSTVYYYFAVSLGLALFTCITLFVVFRLRTEDQIVGRREPEAIATAEAVEGESVGEKRDREVQERRDAGSSGNKMKRIMKTPAVHFMAFYIMIYVGVEVTIGGWAVSHPLEKKTIELISDNVHP